MLLKFYFWPPKSVLQLPIELMHQRKFNMLSYFVTFKRNINDIIYLKKKQIYYLRTSNVFPKKKSSLSKKRKLINIRSLK